MIGAGTLFALPKALTLVGLLSCEPQAAPVVKLDFQQFPAQVTNNLNHQQLGQFKVSTQFSHGSNEVFLMGGITESNIKTEYSIDFMASQMPTRGPCLWATTVNITLTYAPIVHIASEYRQGTCRFESTWQHELRHVNTDLLTLRENAPLIEAAARNAAAALGVMGPLEKNAVSAAQDSISQQVGQAVNAAFARAEQQRAQRQQTIDTREEYLRLSNLCPGER